MVGVNNMDSGSDFTSFTPPDDNESDEHEDDTREAEEDLFEESEISILNDEIDQLNSWLDNMERRNDVLKAELLELLETNRKTREEMAEERKQVEAVASMSLDAAQTDSSKT